MLKNDRRLKFLLKLYKNGKMVYSTHSTRKGFILSVTRGRSADKGIWDRGYLKVTYKKDYHNDLDFYDFDTFQKALSSYTETNLLNYIYEE